MAEYRTRSGRVLTDADIEALAEEAERGYDVEHLLKRDHPLDHEDVAATITLIHVPTQATFAVSGSAPCDDEPTVSALIAELGEQAKDGLLSQLENH